MSGFRYYAGTHEIIKFLDDTNGDCTAPGMTLPKVSYLVFDNGFDDVGNDLLDTEYKSHNPVVIKRGNNEPDKIQIVNDTDTNNGSAKVYSVELTGEANLVTFKSNNQNLIVKTDKNRQYNIDSVLKLNFNKEDCYFFDINSEERLRI